jgi:hypothetical protein
MKRRILYFSLVLLAALSLPTVAQTKAKSRASRNDKPVTVTLLRWPYT